MHWNTSLLPAADALNSIRRDFERAVGQRNREFAGLAAFESPTEFVVTLDVPGVKPEALEITLHEDLLTIEGRREVSVPEGATEIFNDRNAGDFKRVLKMREPVNREGIDAEVRDGVLTIRLPKTTERQPAKIAVRAGGHS
ncbi:MAG: Hsp20/alpha crystallin family protein [Planctomycetaceae bacterium]|nr:Hsp20/alpha crystallin family protein [Planctomycetaceae bacterium]